MKLEKKVHKQHKQVVLIAIQGGTHNIRYQD